MYPAQVISRIDAEIRKKDHLWMEIIYKLDPYIIMMEEKL